MPTCSLPTCTHDAVAQWSRLATAAESGGGATLTTERAALNDEIRRANKRQTIRELTAIGEDPDFNPALLPALKQQIAGEQAALEAITDTVVHVDDRPTVIAVFACPGHVISREQAGRMHEAECMTERPCTCVTGEPFALAGSVPVEFVDPFKD